ncbi:MAG TPA: APC family permease [Acidimicrobiia bacterium]|nr:APC family permease [Acidimicrobiia bacterium]
MYSALKRLLVGRPLPSAEQEHQRLIKTIALAVFSSDAISSTAYATEEILHVLVPLAALAALGYLVPISLIVIVLLAIVAVSYRQTIFAYPGGGGSYVVSRENLGTGPSLVAAASLLTDYVLTVAVSVSAGVAAIVSAEPDLVEHRVGIGLALVALLTVANLRGVKESGQVFAVPTYVYIVILGALIIWGLVDFYFGDLTALPPNEEALHEFTEGKAVLSGVTLFALMRAFSSGAVALTGVEAISNAVPAFRRPEAKNASRTLIAMVAILGTFFLGISVLAQNLRPTLNEHETILSILGRAVFGDGVLYVVLQAATATILILAANTAYNAFPAVCSIIARDGFLPRQLFNRGDRLVFSNGIIALSLAAAGLLVAFGGVTTALIPLYAVGVFTSFTLSQAGMVRHHRRTQGPGWKSGAAVNTVGAVATGIVLVVVVVSKFTIGAWVPVVVIPIIILLFKGVKRHYRQVGLALAVPDDWRPPRLNHTVVVLVGGVHRGVLEALAYARSLAPNHLVAVTVVSDEEEQTRIEEQWAARGLDTPLDIVYSPYRELSRPILRFIDEIDVRWDNDIVTVLIPEFVVRKWWQHLLHNQTALFLKGKLLFREGVVVTSVPYHLRTEAGPLTTRSPR